MLDQFRDPLALFGVFVIILAIFWMITNRIFKGAQPKSLMISIMITAANLLPGWVLFAGPYLTVNEPIARSLWFLGIFFVSIVYFKIIGQVTIYDEKNKKEIVNVGYARWVLILGGFGIFFIFIFFIQYVWIL